VREIVERDRVVTFETTRGSFVIPADVLERAEVTGDDFEIRRAFAIHLPFGAKTYRREKTTDGGTRIYWRAIRIIEL
jgi:hypothetical protein